MITIKRMAVATVTLQCLLSMFDFDESWRLQSVCQLWKVAWLHTRQTELRDRFVKMCLTRWKRIADLSSVSEERRHDAMNAILRMFGDKRCQPVDIFVKIDNADKSWSLHAYGRWPCEHERVVLRCIGRPIKQSASGVTGYQLICTKSIEADGNHPVYGDSRSCLRQVKVEISAFGVRKYTSGGPVFGRSLEGLD